MMADTFDVYADSFSISVSVWGTNVTFSLREAIPSPTTPSIPDTLGTVRMSKEQLKALVYLARQQILNFEFEHGVVTDLPTQVLSQLRIPREDWDAFWKRRGD